MNSKLLKRFARFIPPIDGSLYKGQSGKICVVGGSSTYTGAPFLAAMAALRTGAELAHIICAKDAATAIKSYSPELIVHPLLAVPDRAWRDPLPCFSAAIFGPGLSRDATMINDAFWLLPNMATAQIPIIADADFLSSICQAKVERLEKENITITPNLNEFKRLETALNIQGCEQMSQATGFTVIQKGKVDRIASGAHSTVCDDKGCLKRCGGQGDILCGILATFQAWKFAHFKQSGEISDDLALDNLACAYAACKLMRHVGHAAFEKHGRATVATDMHQEIGKEFSKLFDA